MSLTLQTDGAAVAGDWHGNTDFAVAALSRILECDNLSPRPIEHLLHAGDFGYWPQGDRYLDTLEATVEARNFTIWVTPGNHEWWGDLAVFFETTNHEEPYWVRPHIAVLPPGFRLSVTTSSGRSISLVSIGGAPSIDREARTSHKNWWPEETITAADEKRAIEGGRADVMISHDAPDNGTTAVRQITVSNLPGWSLAIKGYAESGRAAMNRIYATVLPDVLVHGHYHVFDIETLRKSEIGWKLEEQGRTVIASLAADRPVHGKLPDRAFHQNCRFLDFTSKQILRLKRGQKRP